MDPEAKYPIDGDPNTMTRRKFRRAQKAVDRREKAKKKLVGTLQSAIARLAEVEKVKNTLVQYLSALVAEKGGTISVPLASIVAEPTLQFEMVDRGTPEARVIVRLVPTEPKKDGEADAG